MPRFLLLLGRTLNPVVSMRTVSMTICRFILMVVEFCIQMGPIVGVPMRTMMLSTPFLGMSGMIGTTLVSRWISLFLGQGMALYPAFSA